MDALEVQIQCFNNSFTTFSNLKEAFEFAVSEAMKGFPICKMTFDTNGSEYRII